MNDIKWLFEQNAEYAKSYPGEPTMKQMQNKVNSRPFRPFIGMRFKFSYVLVLGNNNLRPSYYNAVTNR
jgi:hypothetical protein